MRTVLWVSIAICLLIETIIFATLPAGRPAPVTPPSVVMEVLDPSLQQFAGAWRVEVARRFPDAVVLMMHGGSAIEGEWLCSNKNYGQYTLVTDVISHYRALYPNRTLVCLACNASAIQLHGFPNVYTALGSVWCLPDRNVADDLNHAMDKLDTGYEPAVSRWASDPETLGNIFEFREAV